MLVFCLLAILLLLQFALANISLHWVRNADSSLYGQALPASEAARQLSQSATALVENAQRLGEINEEVQRQYLGRRLAIESNRMLEAISTLKQLDIEGSDRLKDTASQIISLLTLQGEQTKKRLQLADQLKDQGNALTLAAGRASTLLQSELAVLDSVLLAKLSQGPDQTNLDNIIDLDISRAEQLNRALKLTHQIALMGQAFEAVGRGQNLMPLSPVESEEAQLSPDLLQLIPIESLVRDPLRSRELQLEFSRMEQIRHSEAVSQSLNALQHQLEQRQLAIADILKTMEQTVDTALQSQQRHLIEARNNYLHQLDWAAAGLWITGALILSLLIVVSWQVIYKGIALRLSNATDALNRLSKGETNVTIHSYGDDELTAMASALEAFKQKTADNLRLQQNLRQTAAELSEHKSALEQKVTERTHELARANEQLQEANQAKSLFLATMSHEIRTPLNGLLGTLSLINKTRLPENAQQMLALSQYSGALLQTVLNDILDFSRLEQGSLVNDPRPVALPELLEEVTAIMLGGANLANLELKLITSDIPPWILIDGPKLRQVLFNLLSNAIKFTPEGGVTMTVTRQKEQLLFEVRDTGIGIPQSVMEKLFIPYVTETDNASTRGTGLGLSISHHLVKLMSKNSVDSKQVIEVVSQPGHGSSFRFRLPVEICEHDIGPCEHAPAISPPQRVLLVEDNRVNTLVAQGFLAYLGHQSCVARSLSEARRLLNQGEQFERVMLDVQLPDGSGTELLPRLRQQADNDIQVAAFTAQLQHQDMIDYQALGFDLVLPKPLNLQALRDWLGVANQTNSDSWPSSNVNSADKPTESEITPTHLSTLVNRKQIREDLEVLGHQTVSEMRTLFINKSGDQLSRIEQLYSCNSQQSQQELQSLLHSLKGSCASMGMDALCHYCSTWDKKVRAGERLDVAMVKRLKQLHQESLSALDSVLADKSASE